jgi:hypothetical protein
MYIPVMNRAENVQLGAVSVANREQGESGAENVQKETIERKRRGFRPGFLSCVLPLVLAGVAQPLQAQEREAALIPPALLDALAPEFLAGRGIDATGGTGLLSGGTAPHSGTPELAEFSGRAAVASAILPGSGQWILGQRRWALYVALEGAAWFEYARRRSDGRRLREAYRELAWRVAREPVFGGTRIDADLEYYEAMTRFPASGEFDLEPGTPGVLPESDPETYNGSIWLLAQQLFLPPDAPPDESSPEYARALEYYVDRGVPSELRWDWRGEDAERARFGGLIRDSDEALRRSTTMLGVVIGNHVLSSIDAMISSRVRQFAGDGARVELRIVPLDAAPTPRTGHGHRGFAAGGSRGPWALRATLFH